MDSLDHARAGVSSCMLTGPWSRPEDSNGARTPIACCFTSSVIS